MRKKTGAIEKCQNCGTEFYKKQKETRRFCSIPCWQKVRRQGLLDKIDQKIVDLYVNERVKMSELSVMFNIPESTLWSRFQAAGIKTSIKYTGQHNAQWGGCGRLGAGSLSRLRKSGNCIEITLEDMWDRFNEQKGRCALTGVELVLPYDEKFNKVATKFVTASLDRKDSNLGYTKSNIQWVHKYVNLMKNSLNQEDFIILCNMVSRVHARSADLSTECLDFRIKP